MKTLLAIGLVAAVAPAWALPDEGSPWLELRFGSFTLMSQVDEAEARRIGANLATFRQVLPRVAPQLEPRDGKPLLVFAFRDEASFAPYKGKSKELLEEKLVGFFLRGEDTDYITLRAGVPGGGYTVVYHEFVHQVIAQRFPAIPLWLNEGLAEYYSTFLTSDGRMIVGRPVARHVAWLEDHAPISLRELFNVREESPHYNRPDLVDGFYATSWALVHHLMQSDTRQPSRLAGLLTDLAAAKPEAKSHIAVFGLEYRELEEALGAYVRQDNYAVSSWPLDSTPEIARPEAQGVPRNRLLYRLGEFLAQLDKEHRDAAEAHLEASIALSADDPGAVAALASIRFHEARYDEAAKLFQQAIDKGASDAVTFFRAAKSLLPQSPAPAVRGMFVVDSSTVSPAVLERARELLRHGLALAPDSADALADLGRTYMNAQDDLAPGIEALEKARTLLPSRPDIPWNLAQLYIRQGDRAHAVALIDGPVARLFPPKQVEQAREQLLILDLQAASKLFETGEIDRGIERYRAILPEVRDANLRHRIEGELAAAEAVAAKNRDIRSYNEAVKLANGGDFSGAIRVLEPLKESCKDPEVRQRVEKMLGDLKTAQSQRRR